MVSSSATSSTDRGKQQQQPFPAETIAAFNGSSARIGIAVERNVPTTPWVLYLGQRFEVVAVVTVSGVAKPSDLPSSFLAELEVVLPPPHRDGDNQHEEHVFFKSQIIIQVVQPQAEAIRLAKLACLENNVKWETSYVYRGSASILTASENQKQCFGDAATMLLRASLSLEDDESTPRVCSSNIPISMNVVESSDIFDRLQVQYIKSQSSDARRRSELKVQKKISAVCEVQVMEPLQVRTWSKSISSNSLAVSLELKNIHTSSSLRIWDADVHIDVSQRVLDTLPGGCDTTTNNKKLPIHHRSFSSTLSRSHTSQPSQWKQGLGHSSIPPGTFQAIWIGPHPGNTEFGAHRDHVLIKPGSVYSFVFKLWLSNLMPPSALSWNVQTPLSLTWEVMENDALDYRQQLPMTHMYAVEWNLSDSIEMGCEKQISRAFQSIPPYSVPYNNSVLSTTLSTMVSIRGSLAAHTTTGVLLCVEGPSQAQLKEPFTVTISAKNLSSALMDMHCVFCYSGRQEQEPQDDDTNKDSGSKLATTINQGWLECSTNSGWLDGDLYPLVQTLKLGQLEKRGAEASSSLQVYAVVSIPSKAKADTAFTLLPLRTGLLHLRGLLLCDRISGSYFQSQDHYSVFVL